MKKTAPLYLSMAVAGLAGYLSLWLAVRNLTATQYSIFGAFWAAIYFAVGSLAGIQQEVTRASTQSQPTDVLSPSRSVRAYKYLTLLSIALVVSSTVISAFVFNTTSSQTTAFDINSWILPFIVGLSGYVLVAIIAGNLYGVQNWVLLSWMIFGDAVLRLSLLVITFFIDPQLSNLYWAVALPFPLTIFILSPWLVVELRGKSVSDVGFRKLSINTLQAVVAASGMALIMSGFPLLLAVSSTQEEPNVVSQAMFAITVARAPFLVLAVSLQSLILVKFKEVKNIHNLMFRLSVSFLILAVVATGLSLVIGVPILELLLGTKSTVSAVLIGVIVASGVAIAFLIVTGIAVLSRSLHVVYLCGWIAAAVLTVILLFLPVDFVVRVSSALVISPLVGIAIHLLGLRLKSHLAQ